jgi:hypothetical protein
MPELPKERKTIADFTAPTKSNPQAGNASGKRMLPEEEPLMEIAEFVAQQGLDAMKTKDVLMTLSLPRRKLLMQRFKLKPETARGSLEATEELEAFIANGNPVPFAMRANVAKAGAGIRTPGYIGIGSGIPKAGVPMAAMAARVQAGVQAAQAVLMPPPAKQLKISDTSDAQNAAKVIIPMAKNDAADFGAASAHGASPKGLVAPGLIMPRGSLSWHVPTSGVKPNSGVVVLPPTPPAAKVQAMPDPLM